MIVFKLKDCNIVNIKTSFEPERYIEGSCFTSDGEWEDDTLTLFISIDNSDKIEELSIYNKIAKEAATNLLAWVLNNKDTYQNLTFDEFIKYLSESYSLSELSELTSTNLIKNW